MKISYASAAFLISLAQPFLAQAQRGENRRGGRYHVVTVINHAAPVYVTTTIVRGAGQAEIPPAAPSSSFTSTSTSTPVSVSVSAQVTAPAEQPVVQEKAVDQEESVPEEQTTSPSVTSFTQTSTPTEVVTGTQGKDNSGNPRGSLTIAITNSYGTPLSIALASNTPGPSPDGNPQPTTLASTTSYTFPVGWAGRISVGKSLSGCNSLIEASYDPVFPRAIDVSYVDGYSVPITCSFNGVAVTGCNLELFDQGIECGKPLENEACPNSARFLNDGPAAPFFEACQGSAYTYPHDDTATDGGVTGLEISCCVGTSCPKPKLQKSNKRDLGSPHNADAEPKPKRDVFSSLHEHSHGHHKRHRRTSVRSHAHQLARAAKLG